MAVGKNIEWKKEREINIILPINIQVVGKNSKRGEGKGDGIFLGKKSRLKKGGDEY